jgi:transcriptional regulator with XRE-family HTH domain
MVAHPIVRAVDPVDEHIGARLRLLRRERGLAQEKLGGAVGVSFQQIQKYEKGVNRISTSMLYAIARRLAVPLAAFIEGLPDPALGDPAYGVDPAPSSSEPDGGDEAQNGLDSAP